jgi:hypothetical protein
MRIDLVWWRRCNAMILCGRSGCKNCGAMLKYVVMGVRDDSRKRIPLKHYRYRANALIGPI